MSVSKKSSIDQSQLKKYVVSDFKMNYMLRKIVATTLCSIVMQNIQIFYGGPVMFIVTCFYILFHEI